MLQMLCYRKSRPYRKLKKGKAKKYHAYAQLHHGPTPYHVDLVVRILLALGDGSGEQENNNNTDDDNAEDDNDDDSKQESVVQRIENQILKPCLACNVPVFRKTWDLYEQAKAQEEVAAAAAAAKKQAIADEAQDEDEDGGEEGDEKGAADTVDEIDVDSDDVTTVDSDDDVEDSDEEAVAPSTTTTTPLSSSTEDGESIVPSAEAPITLTKEEAKEVVDKIMYRGRRFVEQGFIRQ
eukprot:CAMPEP_0194068900 /NCGR_PEP_ID=MMETSP0009_2-20130614/87346_1 /TAXON_ID=210454 /ORGANISM="Grammatophora oceanica, Strain CCMP 410" /LENGTH=236 /DNA_ID=CAMNT_0038722037 /DNA_START=1 /DNA_END=714 /DNA_ORIENTATION=-